MREVTPLATAISRSSLSSGPVPRMTRSASTLGHRADEHVGALVVDQPADEQHDLAPGVLGADLLGARQHGGGRLGDVLDVQAVVDDADLVGAARRGTASCRAGWGSRW